jgi:hypothetical protein
MGALAKGNWFKLLLIAAGVAVAAVVVIVASWRHDADRQKYAVAMLPAGASAQQVVMAYLHALDGHDVATAKALSTAGFQGETLSWLQSTAGVQHIVIGRVTQYARQRESDVNVSFRYSSHWWKRDQSFPDGPENWGYTLVPQHGRLLISMDGTG